MLFCLKWSYAEELSLILSFPTIAYLKVAGGKKNACSPVFRDRVTSISISIGKNNNTKKDEKMKFERR